MSGVISLNNKPRVISFASVAGKKESEGPLKDYFDVIKTDTTMGQDSWEMAESNYQKCAFSKALEKGDLSQSDIDILFAGDLINQCTGSGFAIRDMAVPFSGVYGACSTMALTLILASICVDGGYAKKAAAMTSSHFCSAEKQFRKPLEYGGQTPPESQWTVTGAGCVVLGEGNIKSNMPRVEKVAFGKVRDLGITDANNMGAAMAPEDDKLRPYQKMNGMVFSTHKSIKKGLYSILTEMKF